MPDPDKTVEPYRDMYHELQRPQPAGPLLSWQQPDLSEINSRIESLEESVARMEEKINRILIALGCDNKSEIMIVKVANVKH